MWGGGNFITESRPTNFHTFTTRKVLVGDDTPENYREVTAAQRKTIEANDAAFEQPSEELIQQWMATGRNSDLLEHTAYNHLTGFFEKGTLKDITAGEARRILLYGCYRNNRYNPATRINFALDKQYFFADGAPADAFYRDGIIHEACVPGGLQIQAEPTRWFTSCPKLRRIYGSINISWGDGKMWNNIFRDLPMLEDIWLFNLAVSLNFSDSPMLSHTSLAYIIAEKTKNVAITILVHPDVFAKLNDETNTEWHQLLLDAADKQITFATT